MNTTVRYALAFAVVFAAAAFGAVVTSPQMPSWYSQVVTPDFTPPNWLFAPVWFLLYLSMGIALARVWNMQKSALKKRWLTAFTVQLFLNVLWSVLFFMLHGLLLSVICIVILWFAILVMIISSYDLDRPTFWLLIPYLAWVTFALILNISIWWIN